MVHCVLWSVSDGNGLLKVMINLHQLTTNRKTMIEPCRKKRVIYFFNFGLNELELQINFLFQWIHLCMDMQSI